MFALSVSQTASGISIFWRESKGVFSVKEYKFPIPFDGWTAAIRDGNVCMTKGIYTWPFLADFGVFGDHAFDVIPK